jgi:hypothetical protein
MGVDEHRERKAPYISLIGIVGRGISGEVVGPTLAGGVTNETENSIAKRPPFRKLRNAVTDSDRRKRSRRDSPSISPARLNRRVASVDPHGCSLTCKLKSRNEPIIMKQLDQRAT